MRDYILTQFLFGIFSSCSLQSLAVNNNQHNSGPTAFFSSHEQQGAAKFLYFLFLESTGRDSLNFLMLIGYKIAVYLSSVKQVNKARKDL